MSDFVHNDFTMSLPPRWIDSSVVVLSGPPNDGYSPNISVNREKLDFQLSVAEYAAEQLLQLQQGLAEQKYRVVEEIALSLGGLDAIQRTHRFEVEEDDLQIMQMQVYVVKGSEAITVTCTNLAEWFDRTKPIFMEAINQFKWRTAPTAEQRS